uniref:Uncharacterized protein n=1 Tax=Helianthus annuus TaxID=4232 RepID=A0A251THH9_HELAN
MPTTTSQSNSTLHITPNHSAATLLFAPQSLTPYSFWSPIPLLWYTLIATLGHHSKHTSPLFTSAMHQDSPETRRRRRRAL